MKKLLGISTLLTFFIVVSCSDEMTLENFESSEIISANSELSINKTKSFSKEIDPNITVKDYKYGYITGFNEINKEKKEFILRNPGWGIEYSVGFYKYNDKEFGNIGEKVDSEILDEENANTITLMLVKKTFNEDIFNVRFSSSEFFINKTNYLYSRLNDSPEYEKDYWRGLIDGNTNGIWGLNAYE